jgi:hypothetical protein
MGRLHVLKSQPNSMALRNGCIPKSDVEYDKQLTDNKATLKYN